jgi:oligoendopeptidase F
MQKAAQYLKEQNESIRKEAFTKMVDRRRLDSDKLDELFTELIQKRHLLATNAGFDNFRDYKFEALGRFDYTKEDCFDFHKAIKTLIVPVVKEIQQKKLDQLGKEKFKPWDLDFDPAGNAPLKPFETGQEMLEGTKKMFAKIDPYFSDCLKTMEQLGHLDLESKTGKAPGGYNYPLYEIGVPFIFMNAVGAQRDLVTMIHEGGHAVHSFLSRDLELTGFKNLPSEVAELASMSMELLTMPYWEEFYPNKEELKRAKNDQLESVLKVLPWIAQIDAFQHWIYENVNHSIAERHAYWATLSKEYGTGLTDWSGFEDQINTSWQRQLHLFEVPFYYIEYGIAQLGALGIWKNSIENYPKTIQDYKAALSLGYSKSIPEIYKTANIKFDFSSDHLASLIDFIKSELSKL